MQTVRQLKQILMAESKSSGEFDQLVAKIGLQNAKDLIRIRAQKSAQAASNHEKQKKLRIRHGLTEEPYLDAMHAKGMRVRGSFENGKRK